MSRFTLISAAATLALIAVGFQQGSAQVIAYDHRSTVLGDQLAGASELVRAQGAFLKDEATAAETWTRVTAAQDQIQYQRSAYRSDVKRMETELRERKAQSNRERQQAEATADTAEALRLYQSVQRGAGIWPVALRQTRYAGSLATVSSLLRNWSPQEPSSDVYRAALATEIGVLKNRVAADQQLDFASRVEAVKTLKQLQQLAAMPAAELPSQWQERQLAMK
jgi:alkylated DNA nucleotide flippase Atl1